MKSPQTTDACVAGEHTARARARYKTSSAITSSASGWSALQTSVVTGDCFHGSSSSAIRLFGPHSATSSTSSSGTAAVASAFLPSR